MCHSIFFFCLLVLFTQDSSQCENSPEHQFTSSNSVTVPFPEDNSSSADISGSSSFLLADSGKSTSEQTVVQASGDNNETQNGSDKSTAQGVEVLLVSSKHQEIEPGKIIMASFQVTNMTGRDERFNEQISLPDGWRLIIPQRDHLAINSSEQLTRMFTIFISGKALAGSYQITYTLTGEKEKRIRGSDTFTIVVKPLIKIEILTIQSPETVVSGDEYSVSLRLNNRGNASTTNIITIRSTPRYRIRMDKKELVLQPGESKVVSLTVQTEERVSRQINNILEIETTLTDKDGQKKTASATVRVKVIPRRNTEFDPYYRLPTKMSVTFAQEEDGDGYQFEYSGKGSLGENEMNNIYFQFQGPDIQEINPYGRQDKYQFGYSYGSLLEFNFGDRGYTLSPLTKMYMFGRGAEVMLHPKNIDFSTHFSQNRWNKDDRQVGSYLRYRLSDSLIIKGNYYNQQKETDYFNNRIYSLQTTFKKLRMANIEVEYAVNEKDGEKNLTKAYQIAMNGQIKNRIAYDIRKTRADPAFDGYYRDVDYITGNIHALLYKRLLGTFNFRDYSSNLNLDKSRTTANKELYVKSGLNYPFSFGGNISIDIDHFEKKDRIEPADYNFQENTVIFGTGLMFKSLKFRTTVEKGKFSNYLSTKKETDRERYRFSIFFNPIPTQYYSFNVNIGNYKFTESSERSKNAGGKINWKIRENLSLSLDFWKYNFGLGKNRERNSAFTAINYIRKNSHSIDLKAYVSTFRENMDRSVFLRYTVPFNIPVSKIKSIGVLTGRIVDFDKAGNPPMQNVILTLNGISAITNRNGEFIFPSLKPGTYYLQIDQKTIGLIRVTSLKMPCEITIRGGEKTVIEIGIISSVKILGTVKLFSNEQKNKSSSILTSSTINTIQDLSKGDLIEVGGLENILLELSNDNEVIRVLTDSEGEFSFDSLKPGTWSLKVYDDAIPQYHYIENSVRQIELNPGKNININVNVKPQQRRIQFIDSGEISLIVKEENTVPVNTVPINTGSKKQPVDLPFTIQVASNKKLKNAQDDVSRLRDKGYNAIYKLTTVPGKGNWYRVLSGYYTTRQEAVIEAQSLVDFGLIEDSWIKKIDNNEIASQLPKTLEPGNGIISNKNNKIQEFHYSIQLSADQKAQDALNKVTIYRNRGYDAYMVQPSEQKKDNLYRVFIGHYLTREEAEVTARSLTEYGDTQDILINEIDTSSESQKPKKTVFQQKKSVKITNHTDTITLPYTIQVASYRSLKGAMKEVAFYKSKGYDSFQELTSVQGKGDWYRVYVGRYSTKEEAMETARSIITIGLVQNPLIKVLK